MTKGIYKRAGGEVLRERLLTLEKMQALPFERKIELSCAILKKAADVAGDAPVCALYSGGKDSTVLLHLVLRVFRNPIVMYNNTGMCSPVLLDFIRRRTRGLDLVETRPDEEAFHMWKRTGYWPLFGKRTFTERCRKCDGLRVSPVQCCYQLKEAPANRIMKARGVKVAIWGNRADESARRKFSFCDSGVLFQPKKYPWHQCYPLMFWTKSDVLQFIEDEEPSYPYEIAQEAGCWACCTDITHTPNNIQRIFATDRSKFDYMILNGFGSLILRAKGMDCSDEEVRRCLRDTPEIFLRI